jgi:ribosome-binding ATPase YchF (GTP1/OBG family)
MKKIVKLTEADLTRIVKRVINENSNDRIVRGDQILNKSNQKLIDDGFTPYYLDLKKVGDYKIVEVKKINRELPKTTFYFLNEREYELLEKLTNNINELSSDYLKMIDLYKKQLIGVLEQKIIK